MCSNRNLFMNHPIVLLTLASIFLSTAPAQTLESLLAEGNAVRTLKHTTISPDGKKVAWVEEPGPKIREIYVSSSGGPPQRITAATSSVNEPEVAWCSDSERLVFLSD